MPGRSDTCSISGHANVATAEATIETTQLATKNRSTAWNTSPPRRGRSAEAMSTLIATTNTPSQNKAVDWRDRG